MSDTTSSPGLFAERLEYLFQTRVPEGRKKLTYDAVANAINEAAGQTLISRAYVHQLRKGIKKNPGYDHIRALARYFGVREQFFFDEPDTTESDIARIVAIQADGLSETAQQAILGMIQQARAIEGLPTPPQASTQPPHAADTAPQ